MPSITVGFLVPTTNIHYVVVGYRLSDLSTIARSDKLVSDMLQEYVSVTLRIASAPTSLCWIYASLKKRCCFCCCHRVASIFTKSHTTNRNMYCYITTKQTNALFYFLLFGTSNFIIRHPQFNIENSITFFTYARFCIGVNNGFFFISTVGAFKGNV